MRLYLDEDLVNPLFLRALRAAGHDLETPGNVGLLGRSDAVQLTQAIREDRAILTRNYEDYQELHDLLQQAGGRHAGILVIRRDDDPRRNMKPADVVRALRKLEASAPPIADAYHILNHWQ